VAAAGVAHKAWFAELCERPSIRLQLGHACSGSRPGRPSRCTHRRRRSRSSSVRARLLAGALCFVTRRPTLWPRVFSFHEVFHLFTLAGAGAHFALLARTLAR